MNYSNYPTPLPFLFAGVGDDSESYFLSLPEDVQQKMLRESASEDDFHDRLRAYMLKK